MLYKSLLNTLEIVIHDPEFQTQSVLRTEITVISTLFQTFMDEINT